MSIPPAKRRRWLRWFVLALVVVLILAVGGPFVFIHFIEGPPPAKLTLPSTSTTQRSSGSSTAGTTTGAPSFAGTWKVGAGSIVGYRVDEVLIGQSTTAVGRTKKVWGSAVVQGTTVTSADFTVDMATVKSDQPNRNAQFDGRIMNVSRYPTASLKLIAPVVLGSAPVVGATAQQNAKGELTMHGVTKVISFTVSVERTSSGLDVLADIPILFSDWNIANPSVGGVVTTANHGILEVLLLLTKGSGNPVSTAGPSSSNFGGSPITVPSTTVPPLNLSSKS